jgi:membrane protein
VRSPDVGAWFARAKSLLVAAVRAFFDDRGPQLAASMAYFGLFAVFPLTILLVAALGAVVGEETARREVIDFVLRNVPLQEQAGRQDLERLLGQVTANAGAFGVVGVAGLIFSASGLMGSIRNALSRAFSVEERRPLLLGKAVDVLLVLAVGLVGGLSLVLTLLQRIAVSASQTVRDALGDNLSVLTDIVLAAGQLVPILLATIVFSFLYRVVPAREVTWRQALPAGLLAGVLYEVVKTGFAFYLRNVANYGAVYGSIATIIAFLLFAYLTANVFVFGAEVSSVWPRRGSAADARHAQPCTSSSA